MRFIIAFVAALAGAAVAIEQEGAQDVGAGVVVDIQATTTTRHGPWPPRPTTTITTIKPTTAPAPTPTSTSTTVTTIITTLPPKPTTSPTMKPCPTVTHVTRPGDCEPIRCPIPDCTYEEKMIVPCGCGIKTLLSIDGCQKACATGCMTKTQTLSEICAAPTAAAVEIDAEEPSS